MEPVHKEWAPPALAGVALIVGGVALAAAAAASYTDPAATVFLAVAALGLIAAGTVMLVRRPRLTLDPGPTLTVRTLTGRITLTADDVQRVSTLRTRRLAAHSRQLLIDLPDDRLLIFGRWDLGAAPGAVADDLRDAGFRVEER
ncbi:PH domain-containing protein [Gordonia sp. HY285]|uniref:PH domain-containing protein n=1 Tax=Gordonia liuliyuniae TaxID=2911517 RepID=A0ABS9IU72_9ACTN|nr:PH domain-containing protein [Gordonia liuliyuniae]MCF8589109.1 PH domain-containing protein [Gordonia liuliyuniae]MCF8609025.1 PH domain-containing protein [Gordonia liuliyuniae]